MNTFIFRKDALLAQHLQSDLPDPLLVLENRAEDEIGFEPIEKGAMQEDANKLVNGVDYDGLSRNYNDESSSIVGAVLALEKLRNLSLEKFSETGFSPALAKTLNVSVNHQLTLLNWGHPSNLDSNVFDSVPDRPFATELVMEGIGQAIAQGIKNLFSFCYRIIAYIYEAFRGINERARALAQDARSVQTRANAKVSKTVPRQGAVLKQTLLLRFFNEGGKVMNTSDIFPAYKNYIKQYASGFSQEYLTKSASAITTVMANAIEGKPKEEIDKATDALIKDLRQTSFASLVKNDSLSSEDGDIYSAKLPFGNKDINVNLTKKDGLYTGFVMAIKDTLEAEVRLAPDALLKPLTVPVIIEAAKYIEETMVFGIYKSHDSTISKLKSIERAIKGAQSRMDTLAAKNTTGTSANSYSLQFIRDISAGLTQAVIGIHRYEVTTTFRMLALLNASLAAYD